MVFLREGCHQGEDLGNQGEHPENQEEYTDNQEEAIQTLEQIKFCHSGFLGMFCLTSQAPISLTSSSSMAPGVTPPPILYLPQVALSLATLASCSCWSTARAGAGAGVVVVVLRGAGVVLFLPLWPGFGE